MSAWLTVEEAAEYMGKNTKPSTIRSLVRGKKLAHTTVARQLRFKPEWLDEFMEAHKVPVQDNAWGLTDAALANVRDARPASTKRSA